MRIHIHSISVILIFLLISIQVSGQNSFVLTGKVLDSKTLEAIPGTLVRDLEGDKSTISDEKGRFSLDLTQETHVLELSFIGYVKKSIEVTRSNAMDLEILLEHEDLELEGVEVFSTGYQNLPKERATGSFVALDNELIDRRVGFNIMDRLEDVTPGLIFNRAGAESDPISIRGRSTIFANTQPLIVIDNFPYDGPLENINPNDVESITVLRDAAAASIWGARAGNGVIVITTKSGKESQKNMVTFNSNFNLTEAPDLFYKPRMTSSDFIDIEQTLFDRGYYTSLETSNTRSPLSPVVETLIAGRDGLISKEQVLSNIESYRTVDVRDQLGRHFYRPSLNQQHSIGVRGGTAHHDYVFSAGYDNNLEHINDNNNDRLTFNAKNNWSWLSNRLKVGVGLYYVQSQNQTGTELPSPYPYEQLSDLDGTSVPIIRGYSQRFISDLPEGLLDWRYRPIDEIGMMDHASLNRDLRLNGSISYKILDNLNIELLHQYWNGNLSLENRFPQESFFTRDLINRYTQVGVDGTLDRAIPLGDILQWGLAESKSNNFRGQFRYDNIWGHHELNILGGLEIKDLTSDRRQTRYYGYDHSLGLSMPVDYNTLFRSYHNQGQMTRIPNGESISGTVERFVSYYTNIGYSLKKIYNFTVSARKDASNIFGVEANQRGVPLWSAGAGWVISGERFYGQRTVEFLKLRLTYGYNGNIDRNMSAVTTALFRAGSLNRITGLPFVQINNPPNPTLRWERIRNINFGIDFSTRNDRLSGSFDLYQKNGFDLIGVTPFPLSTGFSTFRGNFADTRTKGLDLMVQSENLRSSKFKWNSTFIASYVNEKVTGYEHNASVSNYLLYGDGGGQAAPLEGKPLFAIYSYPWAGLEPNTGMPMGYLDGEASTDYSSIISSITTENMNYHGSARPVFFGAFRNGVSYGGLRLSVNISYRLGYYYRRESIDYDQLLRGNIGHGDYGMRWENELDELKTSIPALPNQLNPNRDNFYKFSSALVEKGDNIRLQDIRISYMFLKSRMPRLPFQRAEIYTYINNIGIIWKASDDILDPDFNTMRPLRSVAMGIKIDL